MLRRRYRLWFVWRLLISIALTASFAHAQFTANFQTNIISGVISNWTGNYIVGSNTYADALVVQNSGLLSNRYAYIGYEAYSTNNSVLVTGSG